MKGNFSISRVIKPIVTVAIIGALGYGGFLAYQWQQGRQAVAAMADRMSSLPSTEPAAKADIKEIVSAAGVVALRNEIKVYSATSEKISEVLVEVGDNVEEGQTIVVYDVQDKRESLQKQIAQSEINLSNQELTLRSMTAPASSSTLKQLQNSVKSYERQLFDATTAASSTAIKIEDQLDAIERADKAVEDAKKNAEESALFLEVGGISNEEHEKALDAVETAENSAAAARNTLRDLERSLEANQRSIALAQEDLEKAKTDLDEVDIVLKDETDRINYEKQENQIASIQLDLSDARKQLADIQESALSPISGIVTSVNVSQGRAVDTSTVLVTIADFSDLIVKADISEYDVPRLKTGQPCVMTSDGLDGISYAGEVTKIADSAVSGGSGTVVPVEFSIEGIDGLLKPGFNLDLDITTAESEGAVTVPIVSVLKDQATGASYVFKVDEARTLRRADVRLGLIGDMIVAVESGVGEGDEIISNPTSSMFDGMPLDGYIREDSGRGGMFEMFGNTGGRGGGGGGAIRSGATTSGTMRSGDVTFSRP